MSLPRSSSLLNKVKTGIKIWLMLAGTVGFSLFILEESSQIATFSTFMSKTNQNHEYVLKAADCMYINNKIIHIVNYTVGWINPLSFISYKQYAQAQELYADMCIVHVLQNQPALLNGRTISIDFTPKEIVSTANHHVYRNGKIAMISDKLMPLTSMHIKGEVINGQIRTFENAQNAY